MIKVLKCVFYMFLILLESVSVAERFTYISTEHPEWTYFNPKYFRNANMSARRYGRDDPFYYVTMHVDVLWPMDNNMTVHFYFYEWLTNVYKPSFVEMHFKMCDLIHNDMFFGSAMRQGKLAQPCPFPAGDYHLYNMTIPVKHIPPHFPFTRGRIYANATNENNELISAGHIDMDIKVFSTRKKVQKKGFRFRAVTVKP